MTTQRHKLLYVRQWSLLMLNIWYVIVRGNPTVSVPIYGGRGYSLATCLRTISLKLVQSIVLLLLMFHTYGLLRT